MCASHVIEIAPSAEEEDVCDMANLFPGTTGLPMTVWVSPRGGARHDVRVMVNMVHGNQMSASNTAVVAVRPTPRLIAGQLDQQDLAAVSDWVIRNTAALAAYWDGQIDTVELGQALQRVV